MQINHGSINTSSKNITEKSMILKNKPPMHPESPLVLQKSNSLTIANVLSNGMISPYLSSNNIAGDWTEINIISHP